MSCNPHSCRAGCTEGQAPVGGARVDQHHPAGRDWLSNLPRMGVGGAGASSLAPLPPPILFLPPHWRRQGHMPRSQAERPRASEGLRVQLGSEHSWLGARPWGTPSALGQCLCLGFHPPPSDHPSSAPAPGQRERSPAFSQDPSSQGYPLAPPTSAGLPVPQSWLQKPRPNLSPHRAPSLPSGMPGSKAQITGLFLF